MTTLHDIQRAFRRALLADDGTEAAALLADDAAAEERLDVHRNTLFVSLTDVLRDTFPAVCRLVDERFFAYAAHEFIRAQPPRGPCLAEYGGGLADFLAGFPPCRHVPYLPDVARLEWLMNVAAHAKDAAPVPPAALAGVAAEDLPQLRLALHPALGLLHSPWPVDRIWRANRGDDDGDAAVDLGAGAVRIEVTRQGDSVLMRSLDPATFVFRQALLRGGTLEAAATDALAAAANFDLSAALADLFRDGVVTAVTILGPKGELP